MKVMLVSPVFPGSLGAYCRNALEELGHNVLVFDYRELAYGSEHFKHKPRSILKKVYLRLVDPVSRMNQKLIAQAGASRPDLLFVIKGELTAPETVQRLTEDLAIPTVLWYPDASALLISRSSDRNIFDSLKFYSVSFLCDVLGAMDEIRKRAKCLEYLTFGCDPSVHKSVALTEAEIQKYGSDICFIGSSHALCERGLSRDQVLESLVGRYDLKIWGRGWERSSLYQTHPQVINPPAYGEELVKVHNASKIAINVNDVHSSLNMRHFEAPACGILLMCNELPKLSEYYSIGEEIVTFKTIQNLHDKIEYYLAREEERIKIAKAGQKRALQDHTIRHRMQEMLAVLGMTVCSR